MRRIVYHCIWMGLTALALLTACNDDESYADRLNEERNAVNAYLANYRVVMSVPEDSIFEVGPDAPFYRIDPDGNVYMQVLNPGDRVNDRAKVSEPIYFRYARYNLATWYADGTWTMTSGNENTMVIIPYPRLRNGATVCSSPCCSWVWSVK